MLYIESTELISKALFITNQKWNLLKDVFYFLVVPKLFLRVIAPITRVSSVS